MPRRDKLMLRPFTKEIYVFRGFNYNRGKEKAENNGLKESSSSLSTTSPSPVLHLDDVCKVFPFDVVVGLDEDLPQDGLSDGVVFGVELVEAVERVAVLRGDVTHGT